MDIVQKIKDVVEGLDELDNYFANIPSKQSENDLAVSDLYHYVEENSISTKGSYRMIKELREHLIVRRELKEHQELLRTFNNNKNKLLQTENRKMLLAEINKTEKRLSTPYNYRIYESEENLKEIIEH